MVWWNCWSKNLRTTNPKRRYLVTFFVALRSVPKKCPKKVSQNMPIDWDWKLWIPGGDPLFDFLGCITFDKTYTPKTNIAPGNGPGPKRGKYTSPQFSGAGKLLVSGRRMERNLTWLYLHRQRHLFWIAWVVGDSLFLYCLGFFLLHRFPFHKEFPESVQTPTETTTSKPNQLPQI